MSKHIKFYLKVAVITLGFITLIKQSPASTLPQYLALPIQSHADATGVALTPIECLTLNIYHEARSESLLGQEAVTHVVMNRVNDPRFPDTVCEVVFQKGWSKKYRRWVPHFSWTRNGKSDKVYEKEAYYTAHIVAVKVYAKLYEYDPTLGATHYHTTNIEPVWSLDERMLVTIEEGLHKFYMWVYRLRLVLRRY